jgi:hypothetical protein
MERQFYWLWAPLNFHDRVTLFHRNDDGDGRPWTRFAAMLPLGFDAEPQRFLAPRSTLMLRPGTRHAAAMTIAFGPAATTIDVAAASAAGAGAGDDRGGAVAQQPDIEVELSPRYEFYMSGIGYGHPVWGHGRNRGELAVGFDAERLAEVDPNDPLHLHVQALCDARLTLADGVERRGQGVLEQLILGRHAPSGLDG